MKIKRFEAGSMSDALRRIKKEFGEEAVILSAKTVKKGSLLLGGKRTQQVVVTAAIDKTSLEAPVPKEPAGAASPQEGGVSAAQADPQGYSRFSILRQFKPITRTGQKKVKPKIVRLMNQSATDDSRGASLEQHLAEMGVRSQTAAQLDLQVQKLLPDASLSDAELPSILSQVIEAMGLVGQPRPERNGGPRAVVFTGPSGVGKTMAAAKLAAKHAIHFRETVGIVSLDNRRMAGAADLERYADMLGIPLVTAGNPDDAAHALENLPHCDLVVVDTPGLSMDDQILRERLRRSLASLAHAEIYLLLHAATRDQVADRIIRFFEPMGPQGLFFTHLDWVEDPGMMINQAVATGWPISFLSDSAKVPEGIHTATATLVAQRLVPQQDTGEAEIRGDEIQVMHKVRKSSTDGFIANRNSDIFHRDTCKSVQRINARNMILFKDPSDAMGRQFKPCRMCCSELLPIKPFERPATGSAGYRC